MLKHSPHDVKMKFTGMKFEISMAIKIWIAVFCNLTDD